MSGQYRRVLRGYDLCEHSGHSRVYLSAPSSEEFDFFAHFLVAISDIDVWEGARRIEGEDEETTTMNREVTIPVRGYFHYVPSTNWHSDADERRAGLLFVHNIHTPDKVEIKYFQAVDGAANVCYSMTITHSKRDIWITKLLIGEDGVDKTAHQWFQARCQLRGEDYVFTTWRVVDGKVPEAFEDTSKFTGYLARFASVYREHPVGKSWLNSESLERITAQTPPNRRWFWEVEKNGHGEMLAVLYYRYGRIRMQIISFRVTDRVVSCSETFYQNERGEWFSGDNQMGQDGTSMTDLEAVTRLQRPRRIQMRVEWVYEGIFNEHLYLALPFR